MKISYGEELHELYVDPSPMEIHQLYMCGMRVIRQGLLYPDECLDMYRANGYTTVELLTPSRYDAGEFLARHKYLELAGALVGPFIFGGELQNEEMTLWRPERLRQVHSESL